MELLFTFGLDPILLVAQIVNFLIIFWVLRKFLYKPVLALLDKRRTQIEEGLRNAQEAQQLLDKTLEKEKTILQKAREEAKLLLEETKAQREALVKETEEATRKQTEIMLQEAREQIVFETKEVEKRLTTHVSQLSVQFLQTAIADLFSQKEQEVIMKNALRKLKDKTK